MRDAREFFDRVGGASDLLAELVAGGDLTAAQLRTFSVWDRGGRAARMSDPDRTARCLCSLLGIDSPSDVARVGDAYRLVHAAHRILFDHGGAADHVGLVAAKCAWYRFVRRERWGEVADNARCWGLSARDEVARVLAWVDAARREAARASERDGAGQFRHAPNLVSLA